MVRAYLPGRGHACTRSIPFGCGLACGMFFFLRALGATLHHDLSAERGTNGWVSHAEMIMDG